MAKQGILHDYDLMANREESAANNTCRVCGTENMTFQWSDYSGEGMCTRCGCPYQLKWGSDEQQKEGKYPYLNIKEEYIPVLTEYWNEKQSFVCFGQMLGPKPGVDSFNLWLEQNHPEMINKSAE